MKIWGDRDINLIGFFLFYLGTVYIYNKYILKTMSVPKHWRLGRWNHQEIIVQQQSFQSSVSNQNVDAHDTFLEKSSSCILSQKIKAPNNLKTDLNRIGKIEWGYLC